MRPRTAFASVWVLALVLMLGACASDPTRGFGPGYTVRRGDTLYSIAWRYDIDTQELARWNGIAPPYTIYPGQRLRMSAPLAAAQDNASQGAARPSTPAPRTPPMHQAPAGKPATGAATPAPRTTLPVPDESRPASALRWQWPADGAVIRTFSADAAGKKGIAIAGSPGQPIRASADGTVVYSGSGLIGYGQLIIVNHNKNFLSAYAHNQRILVKEGDRVAAGQQIAELGSTGTDRPMLHFEIRLNGKPVDPLGYLPKR